jgi:malate synthase
VGGPPGPGRDRDGEFDRVLGDRPNQLDRQRDDVDVSAEQLLDVRVPGGEITEAGCERT